MRHRAAFHTSARDTRYATLDDDASGDEYIRAAADEVKEGRQLASTCISSKLYAALALNTRWRWQKLDALA